VFLGKTKSGVISSIPIGGTEIISDTPVFGLGNIIVTVKASIPGGDTYSKTARGVLLFFFIVGLK
jgi:hypothetical protein